MRVSLLQRLICWRIVARASVALWPSEGEAEWLCDVSAGICHSGLVCADENWKTRRCGLPVKQAEELCACKSSEWGQQVGWIGLTCSMDDETHKIDIPTYKVIILSDNCRLLLRVGVFILT